MTNNKAREVNNPIIKQLLDETTAEELAKIDTEMNNNKQQTALEIFWNQLPEILPFTVDTATAVKLDEAYQQAKEMNKERMINFTEDWYFNGPLLGGGVDVVETIEQHYKQTYGGGEQ
jgi:hypothetical protein